MRRSLSRHCEPHSGAAIHSHIYRLSRVALPCHAVASLLAKAGGLLRFARNDELETAIQTKIIRLWSRMKTALPDRHNLARHRGLRKLHGIDEIYNDERYNDHAIRYRAALNMIGG